MKWNSELYNNSHSFVYEFGKDVVELLNPQKEERILDVGCGSGQLTMQISELANEVIGIDSSPEMIVDALSKYKNIDFRVANAANFNFDVPFDAIFSNATLHWVLDYKKVVKSIYQNLKDNGRFVAEFGGKGNVQTIVNQLRKSLLKKGYDEQANLKQWYFPSIGEYTSVLEDEGFKVDFAQHFDRPTKLASSKSGIKDWILMFGTNFFKGVAKEDIEAITEEVQNKVKETCYINGNWYADYKRIRIIATKE